MVEQDIPAKAGMSCVFLCSISLLFAISNGRIRNIQGESICNMEWKTN